MVLLESRPAYIAEVIVVDGMAVVGGSIAVRTNRVAAGFSPGPTAGSGAHPRRCSIASLPRAKPRGAATDGPCDTA